MDPSRTLSFCSSACNLRASHPWMAWSLIGPVWWCSSIFSILRGLNCGRVAVGSLSASRTSMSRAQKDALSVVVATIWTLWGV